MGKYLLQAAAEIHLHQVLHAFDFSVVDDEAKVFGLRLVLVLLLVLQVLLEF